MCDVCITYSKERRWKHCFHENSFTGLRGSLHDLKGQRNIVKECGFIFKTYFPGRVLADPFCVQRNLFWATIEKHNYMICSSFIQVKRNAESDYMYLSKTTTFANRQMVAIDRFDCFSGHGQSTVLSQLRS